ncbi:hydantoinase/oxoprolinase N-terminal domain-containing protein [Desulfocicer niacini]
MSFVLGIDTGGTYTDGIIMSRTNKKIIAKAKALTTRYDLSVGIRNCINDIDFNEFSDISVVSLSTTLATNAIVEGRGCEVGLLMIGFQPDRDLPVKEIRVVSGGHNIKGIEKSPLDIEKTRAAIESFRGEVDAIAISGYLSVRNPEHELQAQKMVKEILDLPVVCAHHLTRSLGFHERTITAILNARLIPIIKELMISVKCVLKEKKIDASIMIVKGDGSLMGEAQAEDKPIETLLSGPASSIIGATFLSGIDDALILDMGGTTTDIAIIRNKIPRIDEEGAKVGGFLTRVEAAAINTYGLGGDSYIQLNMQRKLQIGPQRVWPISVISAEYPYLVNELKGIEIPYTYLLLYSQITDCFMILNEKKTNNYTEKERRVLEELKDGPHSLLYLSKNMEEQLNLFDLDRLVNIGTLGRISVTPTDILHATGEYTQWNAEGATTAISLLAQRFHMGYDQFINFASDGIVDELCYSCIQSLCYNENLNFVLKESEIGTFFINKQLHPDEKSMLCCTIRPNVPVIGVGAPVKAWLPRMAKRLNAQLIIPEHQEVANAIGSAAGKIIESVKILINPGEFGKGFALHSSWEMKQFKELEEAVAYGKAFASKKAKEAALNDGAVHVDLTVEHKDVYAAANMIEKDIYIESRIEVIATETPEWERSEKKEKFFVDARDS